MTDVVPPPSPAGGIPQDQRVVAMLCHLLALAGIVVPFGNIIGPLVVWLIKKDESPAVDQAGRESLNFQITMTIAGFVAGLLTFVVIGVLLLPIVAIVWLIFVIVATVKTNGGEPYRYPFAIRML